MALFPLIVAAWFHGPRSSPVSEAYMRPNAALKRGGKRPKRPSVSWNVTWNQQLRRPVALKVRSSCPERSSQLRAAALLSPA